MASAPALTSEDPAVSSARSLRDEESLQADLKEGTSKIACQQCGSFYTRPSRNKPRLLTPYTKGILHRCRICKAHFRVRDPNANVVLGGTGVTVAFLGFLGFIVFSPAPQRNTRPAPSDSFESSQSAAQSRTEAAAQRNAGSDAPGSAEAEELRAQVSDLYKEAGSYGDQFPPLEESYRRTVAHFREQMDQVRPAQGSSDKETLNRQTAATSAMLGALETEHERVTSIRSNFQAKLNSVVTHGSKFEQGCTQVKAASAEQAGACGGLASELALLKARSDIVLSGFAHVEQVYREARQATNQLAAGAVAPPQPK